MNRFRLDGETAVVLGGTGALGGAIAQGLGEAGAKVAVLGRNTARGAERVEALIKAGVKAEFFTANAVDRASLLAAKDAVEAAFGPVTILVNAAGGNDPKATVTAERPVEDARPP